MSHKTHASTAKGRAGLVTAATLPWRPLMVIGGVLLAMMAGATLWIVPAGNWFALTAALVGLGGVLALSGLALLLGQHRRASRGLERSSRRGYLLPAMIISLTLAFLASLVPLPLPYAWPSTVLFVVFVLSALWFAWRMIRTAAPAEYQRAQQAYQRGDHAAALALLDEVERDHPDDYGTLHLRALIYRQRRQYDRAREVSERLLELRPDLYYGYAELGLAFLAEGQPARARKPLRRATEVAPELAEGHFNLGIACAEAADDQGAVEALSRALRLGLNDSVTRAMARYHLFVALQALGRQDEAEVERRYLQRYAGVLRRWRHELREGSFSSSEQQKEETLIAAIERVTRPV